MLPVRDIHDGAGLRPQAAPDIAHDADDRARLVIDKLLGDESGSQVCLEAGTEGIPTLALAPAGPLKPGFLRTTTDQAG